MAPEVLEKKPYTFSADVYSYAIALFHIFMEEEPYLKFKHSWQVAEFVLGGQRLDLTPRVPKEIRDLIGVSWAQSPDDRKPFNDISNFLLIIKENMSEVVAHAEKERTEAGDEIPVAASNPNNNPLWVEARDRKYITLTTSAQNKRFTKNSSVSNEKNDSDPKSGIELELKKDKRKDDKNDSDSKSGIELVELKKKIKEKQMTDLIGKLML